MEVHHTHNPTVKRFRHYLFEFLMLFLAVFAGFIAENLREHIVEKQRVRQYMQSLVLDVKSDIQQLKEDQVERKQRYIIMDSIIFLFSSPERNQHTGLLYYYLH